MKKILNFIPLITVIILGVIGWFNLPDVVAVQIGFDGQVSNTLPKIFAILLPVVITIIGTAISITETGRKSKGIILSIIGIVVMIITFFFNC